MAFRTLSQLIVARYASSPFRLFVFTLKSTLLYHLITTHLYHIEPTQGASMLPTISVLGDWVLISKLHRRGRDIKVGDIVAFNSVVDPDERVIKRVIGMEGDYVLRDTPDQDGDMPASMIQVSRILMLCTRDKLAIFTIANMPSRCRKVTAGLLVTICHTQETQDTLDQCQWLLFAARFWPKCFHFQRDTGLMMA